LGTEKVLVTSKTQAKRSDEKLTTNHIPEIFNLTETIQSQMQIPIESREVDEEGLQRRQLTNETVPWITYYQKTCSQCPICKHLHLSLSRKQAIEHFQDEHSEEDSSQAKFPRIWLHRETTCAKCNSFHVFDPIKLSCSNDMCETCLLDLKYFKDESGFFIQCPFCNYGHQVDSMAADFIDRIGIISAEWVMEQESRSR